MSETAEVVLILITITIFSLVGYIAGITDGKKVMLYDIATGKISIKTNISTNYVPVPIEIKENR